MGKLAVKELIELQKCMNETLLCTNGSFVSIGRYIEADIAFQDFIILMAKNSKMFESYYRLTVEAMMTRVLCVAHQVDNEMAIRN